MGKHEAEGLRQCSTCGARTRKKRLDHRKAAQTLLFVAVRILMWVGLYSDHHS